MKDKRLDGISDLRDETDRNGMRVVIELKKDANPQVVLNNLFKQTALQSSFGIIMLALVDNQKQPKILSLRQIIDEYLKHQEEVLTRRTRYDLKKPRSGHICWKVCSLPRTTSTRSSTSSARLTTTPSSA